MNSLNRVTLIGNLGNTPEIFTSQNGRQYTRLAVATHRRWKDDSGQEQSRTDWHYVIAWAGLANNCVQYLNKGSSVYVEGYLSSFDNQKAPEGPRYTTITASNISFLKRGKEENQMMSA